MKIYKQVWEDLREPLILGYAEGNVSDVVSVKEVNNSVVVYYSVTGKNEGFLSANSEDQVGIVLRSFATGKEISEDDFSESIDGRKEIGFYVGTVVLYGGKVVSHVFGTVINYGTYLEGLAEGEDLAKNLEDAYADNDDYGESDCDCDCYAEGDCEDCAEGNDDLPEDCICADCDDICDCGDCERCTRDDLVEPKESKEPKVDVKSMEDADVNAESDDDFGTDFTEALFGEDGWFSPKNLDKFGSEINEAKDRIKAKAKVSEDLGHKNESVNETTNDDGDLPKLNEILGKNYNSIGELLTDVLKSAEVNDVKGKAKEGYNYVKPVVEDLGKKVGVFGNKVKESLAEAKVKSEPKESKPSGWYWHGKPLSQKAFDNYVETNKEFLAHGGSLEDLGLSMPANSKPKEDDTSEQDVEDILNQMAKDIEAELSKNPTLGKVKFPAEDLEDDDDGNEASGWYYRNTKLSVNEMESFIEANKDFLLHGYSLSDLGVNLWETDATGFPLDKVSDFDVWVQQNAEEQIKQNYLNN